MTATGLDLAERTESGSTRAPLPLLDRPGWRTLRADPFGLITGTVFALAAMTPSLLPRSWGFQAVVSGISGATGYGLGVALAWLVRHSPGYRRAADGVRRTVPELWRRTAWPVLLAAIPISLVVVLTVAAGWQRQAYALVGMSPDARAGWLRAAPVIVLIAAVPVVLWRAGRWLARRIAGWLRRRVNLPPGVATAVGLVVVLTLAAGLFDGVVLRWALGAADATFSVANQVTPAGVRQPQAPERSGSPASLSAWDTLGRYGQEFVAGGPSRAQMAAASGLPEAAVREPIRVYVGLERAATYRGRADLAVAELERTGAFRRAVLCVITATGTGWIDSASPAALELMYGGDTAVVATQYSYLPSWISHLFDRDRVDRAGRTLFDAVYDRWRQEPAGHRPQLLVYGESLGTTGSEAAFRSLADVRARTDGALWVGPLYGNHLREQLVARREPGTTEAAPVYREGRTVRFATAPGDLQHPRGPWLRPRVAYLMHPTDPVVWWSPRLLYSRPDWLEEPRGEGVSPAMSWYPVVTFWQVSADLANAAFPPQGYGHNYAAEVLDAWAEVAAPPGWTDEDTDRARAVLG